MAYLCGVCDKDTTGTRCVMCKTCDVWYHTKCDNVSAALFTILDKNPNVAYTCKECLENPPDNSDSAFKAEIRKGFADLKNAIRDIKCEQAEIKSKFDAVVDEIRLELSNNLKELKEEVENCKTLIDANVISNNKKFYELELQNHILQHRLNRPDIVITGLSDKLDNLNETVRNLCAHYKIDIAPDEVLKTMYIKKGNAVLVKFKDVATRDKLMSAYFKSKSLRVSDVVGGTDDKRIYINDNYSSMANKLLKICWKLKNDKKIVGYSIINREILKCKLTMPNKDLKTINLQECIEFFNLSS